jgi:hypothetical protein
MNILIGHSEGIKPMVCDQRTLKAVHDQEPSTVPQVAGKQSIQLGAFQLPKLIERLTGDIAQGTSTEVDHCAALIVEGIPETACPVLAHLGGMFCYPFPTEHTFTRAADTFQQKNWMWLGRHCPATKDFELSSASYESVRPNVRRLSIKRWRNEDRVGNLQLFLSR